MTIRMYFNSLFFFQANEFLECVGGSSSIYGLQPDTVSSLLITLLPPIENDYKPRYQMPNVETPSTEVKMRVLEMLLQALKENAGFQIPVVSGILSPTCIRYDCPLTQYNEFFFCYSAHWRKWNWMLKRCSH